MSPLLMFPCRLPLNQQSGLTTALADGRRIDHLNYGAGHVHGILLDGEEIAGLERDELHREIERKLPNGLTQSQSRDPLGRWKEQILAPTPDKEESIPNHTAPRLPLVKRRYEHDPLGQLTRIEDLGKGQWNYRYDPVGRLIEALSPLGEEKFAFDPAGNPLDPRPIRRDEQSGLPLETEKPPTQKLSDNLLRDYQNIRYRHDTRGNLVERIGPEGRTRYTWNSLDQLIRV